MMANEAATSTYLRSNRSAIARPSSGPTGAASAMIAV